MKTEVARQLHELQATADKRVAELLKFGLDLARKIQAELEADQL